MILQGASASSCGLASSYSGFSAPSSLSFTALDTSGSPGQYFLYYGESATEESDNLSDFSSGFTIPGAQSGSPYGFWSQSEWGAFSSLTYPAGGSGWPWAVNNPNVVPYSGGYDTYCTPGTTCNACEANLSGVGNYDCYGQQIAKSPAIGMRSGSFTAKGFNPRGTPKTGQ